MAERKPFLLRLPPEVMEALQGQAAGDLRSVNAEVEVLLREALKARGVPIRKAARELED